LLTYHTISQFIWQKHHLTKFKVILARSVLLITGLYPAYS